MKTVIISLNCVIDIHHYFDEFRLNEENFIKRTEVFPAGKGVNVAKALKSFSAPYELFLLLGKENSDLFSELLVREDLTAHVELSRGKTRENISVHSKNISETRICSNDFYATDDDCINVLTKAYECVECGDVVVISGRFPNSVSKEKIMPFIGKFNQKNVCLVLDSTFFTEKDFICLKPFLIKPNENEIKAFGENEKESVELLLKSGVKNVVISKGDKGAELYTFNNSYVAMPPAIFPLSTVGAGDSFIAGVAYSVMEGYDIEKLLKTSVAFGTSCCLTEGGKPPLRCDIEVIYKDILVSNKN